MNNEYISRDTVINITVETGAWETQNRVRELPAEDVQPIKHGRWIDIYEYCEKNGYVPSGMGIYYWCSKCGKSEKKTSDFCPNCGARMDGNTVIQEEKNND